MVSRWQWIALQLTRTLWIRVALLCLLAIVAALGAAVFGPWIPVSFSTKIGADAVGQILNILASSMLAVTTFSLSVMVSAYSAAASNVTPRATKLLMQDSTTQNVLATFMGSFVYALVGIVALSRNVYGSSGRVVVFVATVGVIVLIVVTMLRWIEHLNRLGRVGDTTARVEKATLAAFRNRLNDPYLGGQPLLDTGAIPQDAVAVFSDTVGYLQYVDTAMLSDCAEANGWTIYVAVLPGNFIDPCKPLAFIDRGPKDATSEDGDEGGCESVASAFSVGEERSFDQDPRFGLIVLAEIGSRALSPGVNDPGTAIDVIGRAVRLLLVWDSKSSETLPEDVRCPRVRVMGISVQDMFDDIFTPLARDGASLLEIQTRLQKALATLHDCGGPAFKRAAVRHARLAAERAAHGLTLESERAQLERLAAEVERPANAYRG